MIGREKERKKSENDACVNKLFFFIPTDFFIDHNFMYMVIRYTSFIKNEGNTSHYDNIEDNNPFTYICFFVFLSLVTTTGI
jgi:hypothetical protein